MNWIKATDRHPTPEEVLSNGCRYDKKILCLTEGINNTFTTVLCTFYPDHKVFYNGLYKANVIYWCLIDIKL